MTAAVAGIVFAIGLVISDMTSPARVIGFVDVTGGWDPTLGFVMAGAIAVFAPVVRLVKNRPLYGPAQSAIDLRLVGGSAIFGIGWGLAGLCPGPALASVGAAFENGLFVLAMIAGMALARSGLRRAS